MLIRPWGCPWGWSEDTQQRLLAPAAVLLHSLTAASMFSRPPALCDSASHASVWRVITSRKEGMEARTDAGLRELAWWRRCGCSW